jgi:hypothetical protein
MLQVALPHLSNYALERMEGTHGLVAYFQTTAQFEAVRPLRYW